MHYIFGIMGFSTFLFVGYAILTGNEIPYEVNKSKQEEVKGTLIGGAFELTDHNGVAVSNKSYEGKYIFAFFGFTHCPDVCPTDLLIMSQVLDGLGESAKKIAPLFITIDPERDTSESMKKYLANFHPSIIGLTGSKTQIAAAALKYKVFYSKVEDKKSALDYSMNHSAYMYFQNKQGMYLTHFAHESDPDEIIKKINELIE